MSKRFGRNQKRKLREQLNEASKGLSMANGLISHQRSIIDERDHSLRMVAEMLGEHFVALEPQERQIQDPYRDTMIPAPRRFMANASLPPQQIQRAVLNSIIALKHSRLEGCVDKLMNCVHFRYTTAGGQVGYSVSIETWLSMPIAVRYDIAVREISREMSAFLAKNPEILEG